MLIDWWIPLLIIFGGAMFLLLKGIPVAFAFVIVNMLGVLFLQGGGAAFKCGHDGGLIFPGG